MGMDILENAINQCRYKFGEIARFMQGVSKIYLMSVLLFPLMYLNI